MMSTASQNATPSASQKWLRSLVNILVLITALIGGLQWAAALAGEGVVQPFRSLKAFRPELLKGRYEVLSLNIRNEDSAESHWQALQPALTLLWAINPEISQWMEQLHREDRILWKEGNTLFNWPVIASYDWRFNDFYFGPGFWKLTEGQKASVIAHEYFHYRQNKLWLVGDTILETLTGKLSEYGSRTEDEAHLYQWYAFRAMGMPPDDIVKSYFSQRNLYRFVLSQPVEAG